MDWPVTYRRKVRYSDTDAQGIVFNGNFATYFDDALTDYFDATRFEWGGVEVVLRRMEIDFHSPGRLGEVLVTGARVDKIGNTSMTMHLRTWEEESGRVLADAHQVQVVVSGDEFRPVPVPDELVAAVEELQGEVTR